MSPKYKGKTRYRIKSGIVMLFQLVTWPLFVPSLIAYHIFESERVFASSAQFLSLFPGRIGQYLRASFYCRTLKKCESDIMVGFCSFFAHPTAEVGRHVVISSFSIIGTATIGNSVLISARASILSGKHQHETSRSESIGDQSQKNYYKRIYIGDYSWIGEGAIVMANLGENTVVGTGSVVSRDMPANMIALGNPSRFIPREATRV